MIKNDPLFKEIRITKVIQETAEAKSFEFEFVNNPAVDYAAGQFITLVFPKTDHEDRRSYSFSSAPLFNEPLKITVKRVANGEYSRWLLHHCKEGDRVLTTGVSGFFKLPPEKVATRQFVFIAAGSGISPVLSLLKTVLSQGTARVLLIYSNRNERSTIFFSELKNLAIEFRDRFEVEFIFSHSKDLRKNRLSKVLLNSLLESYKIQLRESLFYLCGPVDFMLVASITLVTAGVSVHQIKKEIFSTRKHQLQPVPPDTRIHQAEIHLQDKIYRLYVQYPDTILAAAKKLHIPLPYSCEAGNCGSCAASCVSGTVWMAYNEVLLDDEIAQGVILTCQGYPVNGDVIIKI